MKYIIYLITAGMFFSCADNQLEPVGDALQPIEVLTTKAEMPDVSVENGYLVLKDLDALDALEASLAEMSDEAFLAWEKQVGFESAQTFFMPYFDEFDALEKEEDMLKFQEEHKDVLRIINEDGMCDVDYPFDARGSASILSKEGKIKVGNALWLFKKDRKITILNATDAKVNEYLDAEITNESNGIYVDYYQGRNVQTKMGQMDGYVSLAGDTIEVGDSRAYKWSLDRYPVRDGMETHYTFALYQQGYDVKNGKPNKTIKTRYECTINSLTINKQKVMNENINKKITSGKGRGGRYFGIFKVTKGNLPTFSLSITHRSQGYVPAKNPLIYSTPEPFPLPPTVCTWELILKYSRT